MNRHKIMIIDDDADILALLEKALNIEGFDNITTIDNGEDAVRACKEVQPDVIILDVMLPGIDGYEVCRQIRHFFHCPIIFLLPENDELDKILGLAAGGDDYVTKPFNPKEIVYRIRAELRREKYHQSSIQSSTVKIGALIIEPDSCRVTKDNKDIGLTATEFEILLYLARNIGEVVSRERLYEAVWGEDSIGCDNTIMVHIRHLREKLESNPASPEYITTVRGLGYKLLDPNEK